MVKRRRLLAQVRDAGLLTRCDRNKYSAGEMCGGSAIAWL